MWFMPNHNWQVTYVTYLTKLSQGIVANIHALKLIWYFNLMINSVIIRIGRYKLKLYKKIKILCSLLLLLLLLFMLSLIEESWCWYHYRNVDVKAGMVSNSQSCSQCHILLVWIPHFWSWPQDQFDIIFYYTNSHWKIF